MQFTSRYTLAAALLGFSSSTALAEQVVISEIMYHPKEGQLEYLEIRNLTSTPFDIAEWAVSNGVDFQFPQFSGSSERETFLEAFETIVLCGVAPSDFKATYNLPQEARVFGPWTGSLSNSGERITLTDKNGVDLCTVSYNDRGDWPVSPDGTGHSLELTNPNRMIDDPAVWSASLSSNPVPGSVPAASPEEPFEDPSLDLQQGFTLIDFTDKWDFNDQNVPVAANWQTVDYDFSDTGWTMEEDTANRGGLYGFSSNLDELPSPMLQTLLKSSEGFENHITYFFRKEFEFSTGGAVNLSVDSIIDDGGHFYLNGTPIGGAGLGPNPSRSQEASRALRNATLELNVGTNDGSALVEGTNVISCEVHQSSATSSDIIFAGRLRVSFPTANDLKINEVVPGVAGVGFVELYNATSSPIPLNGWYLSDSSGQLTKTQLTTDTIVPAFGLASVGFAELGFPISSNTTLFLTKPDAATITDGISAAIPFDGRSLGRKPAGSDQWFLFTQPTQDAPNASSDSVVDLRINELQFNAEGLCEWVEIFNPTNEAVDTSGLFLSNNRELTGKVPLSGSIEGRDFLSADTAFTTGESRITIYLSDSNDRVIDSESLRIGTTNIAAFPDGSNDFFRTSSASTRDAANAPQRQTDIVINELMPDPPGKERDAEFIELYNKGAQTVDLSDWRFSDGVNFTFPMGTTLAPGAYAVIVANADVTSGPAVIGEYTGRLSNRSETLRLVDALGNTADEVRYYTGGAWPELANGQGSSLELKHPEMDNSVGSAWGASNERNKTDFQSFSISGRYLQRVTDGGGRDYRELHLRGADNCEIVLRNFNITRNGAATNLLDPEGAQLSPDGTAIEGWLCQGNHHKSFIENGELHMIADGSGDEKANHCQVDIVSIEANDDLALSFEARWISGTPVVQIETWDGSFGDTFRLPIPSDLGTPGVANTAAIATALPTIESAVHSPVVPKSADTVTITAKVGDADIVNLRSRLDTVDDSQPWGTLPMFDDGTNGDEIANDGIYTAETNNFQANGIIVQFYVEASFTGGDAVTYPKLGPAAPAMWIVDNNNIQNDLRTNRFIICARDVDASGANGAGAAYDYDFPRLSNHYFNCTFISDENEVIYNCEIRKGGSPFSRLVSASFVRAKWKTPTDQRFRNFAKRIMDDDAAGNAAYRNRIIRYWLYLLGNPSNQNETVRTIINGNTPILTEELEGNGNDFLRRNWNDGLEADLYRIDDEFFLGDTTDVNNPGADAKEDRLDANWAYKGDYEIRNYHRNWNKRSQRDEFDYTPLMQWMDSVGNNSFTQEEMERMADIDQMAAFAVVRGWADDWDGFTKERGKNGYFLRRPTDNRWTLLQWDSDNSFRRDGNNTPQTSSFFGDNSGATLPGIRNFYDKPYVRQRVNYFLQEMIDRYTQDSARLRAWFDAEERASDSYTVPSTFFNSWNADRQSRAIQEMGNAANSILTVSTSTAPTTEDVIDLMGTSPPGAFLLLAPDHPEAVFTFTEQDRWTLSGVFLMEGVNDIIIEVLDRFGNVIDTFTFTITKTGNGSPFVSINGSPKSFNTDAAESVTLDGSESFDPEGTALTYLWSTITGATLSAPGSPVTSVSFDAPGIYPVTLTLTDADGKSATLTREIIAYADENWSPFSDDELQPFWDISELELKRGNITQNWYSLSERPNSLTMKVDGSTARPFQHVLPQFPSLMQELPTGDQWSIQTDIALASIQKGEFLAGLSITLDDTSYAIGMEDGDTIAVLKSDGVSSTLEVTRFWSEEEATLRVTRNGMNVSFCYRVQPGEWLNIYELDLTAEPVVQKGGIFASTKIARELKVAFDYALVINPALTNSPIENLRITELMYHSMNDDPLAEYLELHNSGTTPIVLDGVSFDAGSPFRLKYTIPNGNTLAPGEYGLLVRSIAGFGERYMGTFNIIDEWLEGGLSNGGEQIIMRDADGKIIQQFTYDDGNDWPQTPDGEGPSLEIFNFNENYDLGSNWRSSGLPGGSPGEAADFDGDGLNTAEEFAAGTDPDDPDFDKDGVNDGDEIALGTNPLVPDTEFKITSISATGNPNELEITWESINNVKYQLETSTTLEESDAAWEPLQVITATSSAQSTIVTRDVIKRFYRLRITQ